MTGYPAPVDGQPWIVMEWVDGASLAGLIEEQGALMPPRTVDGGRQLAAALGAVQSTRTRARSCRTGARRRPRPRPPGRQRAGVRGRLHRHGRSVQGRLRCATPPTPSVAQW
ncbi:hypothetical protein ACFV98_04830 [Streptomyces violascens]|uniref:hypothetical protein n=1 Tax=Streptomyces violascens TaxID=67381 RepID=UPI003658FA7B